MSIRGLATIAVAAVMSVLVPGNAQSATIEEVLHITGDIWAITRLCPQREPARESYTQFIADSGMSTSQYTEGGIYYQDLYALHLKAIQARKAKTMQENCADAEKLYGENGSVIQLKWVDVPPKSTGK